MAKKKQETLIEFPGAGVTVSSDALQKIADSLDSKSTLIDSYCSVKHLNMRKEGPDDVKVLAIDIKFIEANCTLDFLARILGVDLIADVKASLWDAEGNKRFIAMEPFSSWADIAQCSVRVGGLVLPGCNIHKFKVNPGENHSASMEFSASITNPPSNAAPILAEYIGEYVQVTVIKQQNELDFTAAEEELESEGAHD
jgi:hypothetical protein